MRPKKRFQVVALTMILLLSMTACATTDLPYARKVKEGEPAPADGMFLTAEGAKKQAQVTKERNALREELRNYPGKTDRVVRNAGWFGAGLGVGVLLPLLLP
jgi:hypothetical protein